MSNEEILEGNKLIAEFMCCEKFEFIDDFDKDLSGVRINDSVYPFCSLEYHSSWKWLMLVVEKIESMDCTSRFYIFKNFARLEPDQLHDFVFSWFRGYKNTGSLRSGNKIYPMVQSK